MWYTGIHISKTTHTHKNKIIKTKHFFTIFLSHFICVVGGGADIHVKVRGQFVGTSLAFHYVGLEDWMPVFSLSSPLEVFRVLLGCFSWSHDGWVSSLPFPGKIFLICVPCNHQNVSFVYSVPCVSDAASSFIAFVQAELFSPSICLKLFFSLLIVTLMFSFIC